MRKVTKKKKLVEVIESEQYFCDKCKEEIEEENGSAFNMVFEITTGESYPYAGFGDRYEMDLCKKCSLELVDKLKAQGYRVQETEWDV
jgi:hypothetical protein